MMVVLVKTYIMAPNTLLKVYSHSTRKAIWFSHPGNSCHVEKRHRGGGLAIRELPSSPPGGTLDTFAKAPSGQSLDRLTLTLSHPAVLCALDPLAVVEPGDGGIRQPSHFTFKHRLLSLHHVQVVKGLDEIRHGEAFNLVLRHLRLLGDGRHLLQLGPCGGERDQERRQITNVKGAWLRLRLGALCLTSGRRWLAGAPGCTARLSSRTRRGCSGP